MIFSMVDWKSMIGKPGGPPFWPPPPGWSPPAPSTSPPVETQTEDSSKEVKAAEKAAKDEAKQQRRDAARQTLQERKDLKESSFALAKCEGGNVKLGKNRIALTGTDVVLLGSGRRNTCVPLQGAVARVETTHQMTSRLSVGAEVTLGLLASKTRKYDLTYLTIEHPLGHGIQVEVYKRDVAQARKIAVAVNTAAQALGDPPAPASARIATQQGPADQLAKLAELYAQGSLTEEEFAAAKAAVIANPNPI